MSATTDAAHKFWTHKTDSSKYQSLVEQYEKNIEITKPREEYECEYLPVGGHCSFCASNVTYYEYNGPNI